jgi:hypothetical protein
MGLYGGPRLCRVQLLDLMSARVKRFRDSALNYLSRRSAFYAHKPYSAGESSPIIVFRTTVIGGKPCPMNVS